MSRCQSVQGSTATARRTRRSGNALGRTDLFICTALSFFIKSFSFNSNSFENIIMNSFKWIGLIEELVYYFGFK